jgi:hypothetical protein
MCRFDLALIPAERNWCFSTAMVLCETQRGMEMAIAARSPLSAQQIIRRMFWSRIRRNTENLPRLPRARGGKSRRSGAYGKVIASEKGRVDAPANFGGLVFVIQRGAV